MSLFSLGVMRAKDIFSAEMPVGVVYRSTTPNGLQFVRSLGEAGVQVLALGDGGRAMGMYSKYAYPMLCPDGMREENAFLHFLEKIGQKLAQKATLFLMNDPHVVTVAHHRHLLDEYYRIPLPNWEVLERCLNKAKMYDVAHQAGVPIPVTYTLTSDEEAEKISRQIPYPCILKPISRYEYRDGVLRQKAFQHTYGSKAWRAKNADELVSQFRRTKVDDFRVIVQEEIPGPEDALYTVGIYADRQSELRGVFTGRKLRQLPPDFGTCTYGESLNQPGIVDLGERLVKALGFHGIAQIEFKLDARDGKFKLMEINPRGWQWSYLATACGVNLPYIAYCDLNGLPLPVAPQTTMRKTWTHMGDDFQHFWQFGRKGRLCERMSLWAWLTWAWLTILCKDNHDAVFSWRDPLPGLMVILSPIRRVLRGLRRSLRTLLWRGMREPA